MRVWLDDKEGGRSLLYKGVGDRVSAYGSRGRCWRCWTTARTGPGDGLTNLDLDQASLLHGRRRGLFLAKAGVGGGGRGRGGTGVQGEGRDVFQGGGSSSRAEEEEGSLGKGKCSGRRRQSGVSRRRQSGGNWTADEGPWKALERCRPSRLTP